MAEALKIVGYEPGSSADFIGPIPIYERVENSGEGRSQLNEVIEPEVTESAEEAVG